MKLTFRLFLCGIFVALISSCKQVVQVSKTSTFDTLSQLTRYAALSPISVDSKTLINSLYRSRIIPNVSNEFGTTIKVSENIWGDNSYAAISRESIVGISFESIYHLDEYLRLLTAVVSGHVDYVCFLEDLFLNLSSDTVGHNYQDMINAEYPMILQFYYFYSELNVYSPGDILVDNCRFHGSVNCQSNNATFTSCKFDKDIRLQGNTFFSDCRMGSKMNLTSFSHDSILMYKCDLPDTIDLQKSNLEYILDLTNCFKTHGKCVINLMNANIAQIKLQYRNFELYFPDSIKWNPNSYDEISNIYEGLLKNFQGYGYQDSYKKLDVEYKRWQSHFSIFDRVTGIISDSWWKFGYSKWRILIWAFCFYLVFSFFNWARYNQLTKNYYVESLDIEKIRTGRLTALTKKEQFLIAILYTGFIFFKLGIDFKNLKFHSGKYIAVLIFQYTIGLVCTAFLLNWIFKG